MSTYNLFLSASQADDAITNAYRLFDPEGLTGENISLYGGDINHWGTISSTKINITGDVGEESFINRLTGGIRVQGDCEFDTILNGIDIYGVSYIQSLTGGLNVTNGGINVIGNSYNNGSFINQGSVSINGSTSITGLTTVVGNTEIIGNFYQSGFFDVISSDAEFRANVNITGSLDVNGPLNINGDTVITSTNGLTISGPANVNGNSTLNGTTNIVGELLLNGQPFITQAVYETTEVNYFLTGGECVEALTGFGEGVVQLSNLALKPNDEGVANGIAGTTFGTVLSGLAARGSGAVDLQMLRNSNVQIASGRASAILAGESNMASGIRSAIIGGIANTGISVNSVIIGGERNKTLEPYSVILGGLLAETRNWGEVTQGGGIGQRSSILGSWPGYSPAIASDVPIWGVSSTSTYGSTGIYIGSSYLSAKIRAFAIDGSTCNVDDFEFKVIAGPGGVSSITPATHVSCYIENDELIILPTGDLEGDTIFFSADILYTNFNGFACTTSAPMAFNTNDNLDTLFS